MDGAFSCLINSIFVSRVYTLELHAEASHFHQAYFMSSPQTCSIARWRSASLAARLVTGNKKAARFHNSTLTVDASLHPIPNRFLVALVVSEDSGN